MGFQNIHFKLGNGWQGWPEKAPFDKIIVTAAPEVIPEALICQLKDGGRIAVPVGKTHGVQTLITGAKHHGVIETLSEIAVRFVPLTGQEDAR